jgi:hypothetical protein
MPPSPGRRRLLGASLLPASPSQGVVAWSGGESWNSFETP